jgi:hypothetical protein
VIHLLCSKLLRLANEWEWNEVATGGPITRYEGIMRITCRVLLETTPLQNQAASADFGSCAHFHALS